MRVLLQLAPGLAAGRFIERAASDPLRDLRRQAPDFRIDGSFSPVQLPPRIPDVQLYFDRERRGPDYSAGLDTSVVIRGWVPDEKALAYAETLPLSIPGLLGVFSDPPVATATVCMSSPAEGTEADVRSLVSSLAAAGLTGHGVPVAVVDGGFSREALLKRGRTNPVDASRSWIGAGGKAAGQAPVGHGTTSAYAVGIAAPQATLLDIAVLHRYKGRDLAAFLSDVLKAYEHLRAVGVAFAPNGFVINNSWAVFDPKTDFPEGHPSHYLSNPEHPFNVLVETIEREGADVVFAAGNCGPTCPASKCRFDRGMRTIGGANSHPSALCVGAATASGKEADYSSLGPGRLDPDKPDILGFAHFAGFEQVDVGTSVASPVIAGVIAAIRQQHSSAAVSPAGLRNLIRATGSPSAGATPLMDVDALVAALP